MLYPQGSRTVDCTVFFSGWGRGQRGCHWSRGLHPCCGMECGLWCPGWGATVAGRISGGTGLDVYVWSICLLQTPIMFLLPLLAQELSDGEDASPQARPPCSLTFVFPARPGTLSPEQSDSPSVNSEAMRLCFRFRLVIKCSRFNVSKLYGLKFCLSYNLEVKEKNNK